jgi:ATP adenylyltransferase
MPVIGDTRVLVEALDDTYDRLHAAFASHRDAVTSPTADRAVELSFAGVGDPDLGSDGGR